MKSCAVPKVVVRRYIEFAGVRYNGAGIPEKTVQRMEAYVEFIPICPELENGSGVPDKRLVQCGRGEYLTDKGMQLSETFVKHFPSADGLLLKSRSQIYGEQGMKGD